MGQWTKGQIRQVWNTVISTDTGIIYSWRDGVVRHYEQRSRGQYQYARNSNEQSFPLKSTPISGQFQSGLFITSGFSTVEQISKSFPTINKQMRRMNRGVLTNVPKESITKAIWEGQAIMGTDGSVRNPLATYSFVISLSQIEVATCAKGGGFLPTTAKYLDPYSQRTKADALLAGLCWIKALLTRFPNHTHNNPPSLPIPIDNKAVVTDVNKEHIVNQSNSRHHLSCCTTYPAALFFHLSSGHSNMVWLIAPCVMLVHLFCASFFLCVLLAGFCR
jgi:hypothetical protein